jgi:hypothetical protein
MLAVLIIVGMFILRSVMSSMAHRMVEQGVEKIPRYLIVFFEAAAFWGMYWWFLVPAIFVGLLFVAALTRKPAR